MILRMIDMRGRWELENMAGRGFNHNQKFKGPLSLIS